MTTRQLLNKALIETRQLRKRLKWTVDNYKSYKENEFEIILNKQIERLKTQTVKIFNLLKETQGGAK